MVIDAAIFIADDRIGARLGRRDRQHVVVARMHFDVDVLGPRPRDVVGVEARVLLGPAGTSGTYTAPVSITMLRGTKVVASRVTRGSVTLANGQAQGSIVMVERDIIVPQGAEELVIQLSLKGSGGGEASALSAKKKQLKRLSWYVL